MEQVANIVIYYQEKEHESTESAIKYINKVIEQVEEQYVIKGVFIDRFNRKDELTELIHSRLNELDFLLLEKPLEDDFDKQLFYQLAKTEKFKFIYFNEI